MADKTLTETERQIPEIEAGMSDYQKAYALDVTEDQYLKIKEGSIKERSAQGRPTVVEDDEGERYFLPGSTPYESGHRIESERVKDGGRPLGVHSGDLVPENTIIITEGGKPRQRIVRGEEADIADYVKRGEVRYPVKNTEGKEVLLTPRQVDKLNKAKTEEQRFDLYKEFRVVPKDARFLTESEIEASEKKYQAAKFTEQQFTRSNTQLPDGHYISNRDLKSIKKESPEVYNMLVTKGFDAANNYVAEYNKQVGEHNKAIQETQDILSGKIPEGKSWADTAKTVYRALTPWDEDAGQSFIDYMKKYPERLKATVISEGKTQEELKRLYEEQQADKKAPLWSQIVFAPEHTVMYNERTGNYTMLMGGEAPLVGGKKIVPEVARRISPMVRTLERADLSPAVFSKIRKAAPKNVDWGKILEALNKGRINNARELAAAARKAKQTGKLLPSERQNLLEKMAKAAEEIRKQKYIDLDHKLRAEAARNLRNLKTKEAFSKEIARQTKAANQSIADTLKQIAPIDPSKSRYYQNLLKSNPTKAAEWLKQQRSFTRSPNIGRVILLPTPATKSQSQTLTQIQRLQQRVEQLQRQSRTSTQAQQQIQQLVNQQTKLKNSLQRQLQEQVQTQTTSAVALSLALQNLTQTQTQTRTQQQTKTELQNAIKTALQNMTATQTRTRQQQQTQTKLEQQLETLLETKLKPAEKLETVTQLQPVTKTKSPTKEPTTPRTPRTPSKPGKPPRPETPPETPPPPLLIRLPGSKADKAARETIKKAGGAIGWRQGQVGKYERWDVIKYPYRTNEDFIMVLGRRPTGVTIVVRGRGSAYKTAQVFRGRIPKRPVTVDSGFQDVTVVPKGKKRIGVEFKPDPKLETKSDITIGSGNVRISEGQPRISQKQPRISEERARLS